ncbi:MAG: hypothetical protein EOO73_11690 [Myxococcales bacterium]|nr:MAG: hypothetical protein EOO73_11690 [Myxococcales bacterium]
MKSREGRWNELQSRWASGEPLSAEEEQERLAYALHDALARRELEIFEEIRARGAAPETPAPPAVVGRALDAIHGSPRLRLVTTVNESAPEASPPHRPRWRAASIAAPGLLLAAASLVALWPSGPSRPPPVVPPTALRAPTPESLSRAELVLAAGEAEVTGRRTGVGQNPLGEGETVTTGEGRACLTIDPGIDVCLGAHTTLQLESLAAASIRLRVERGTALATLSRRAPGSAFSLLTENVAALAHGTTYAVRREGDETDVIVVEGTVEVTRGSSERALVDAHSRVSFPSPSATSVRAVVGRSEEARLLALSAPRPWSGTALGVLELAAPLSGSLFASIDEGESLPLPLQTLASAGTHRIGWRDAGGAESTVWAEVVAGERRSLTPPPVGSAPAAAAIPAENPSPGSLLQLARRELARSRPRQALTLYEQLRAAYPASAEARTVLVTMGKLELDLGRSQRALGRFEAYLRDGGALVPEALAGKARALRALGRGAEERRAIQQYLAAHPGGFEAPLFAKRLHELGGP